MFAAATAESLLAWTAGLLYVCYDTWLIAYVAWHTRDLGAPSALEAIGLPPGARLGVAIACRNEAAGIVQTVELVLCQDRPAERIIVIDDGSTDHTLAVLTARFQFEEGSGLRASALYPTLFLLAKPNSGKADSLNQAAALIGTEVLVSIDADTYLAPHALAALRQAFDAEPELVAACGILVPRCHSSPFARWFEAFQHFEYLRAFLSRAAWMQANALLLVSGAFAGYRTSALTKIGGHDARSLVEDYELIHRLYRHAADHGLDWRIRVHARKPMHPPHSALFYSSGAAGLPDFCAPSSSTAR